MENPKYFKEIARHSTRYKGKFSISELIDDLDAVAAKHEVDMEFIHDLSATLTWRGKQ